jgi:hypothetical protein
MKNMVPLCGLPLLLFSCASAPRPAAGFAPVPRPAANPAPAVRPVQNAPVPVQYDSARNLDAAVRAAADYVIGKTPAHSTIGVVSMSSPSPALSNYVIDSLVMYLVNDGSFTVIERADLAGIQQEQKYQLSGEVSDETAVSIGRQLGIGTIVTGSMTPLGNDYSLRLKIANVETAQIIGTQIYKVSSDNVLLSLVKESVAKPAQNETSPKPEKPPQQQIINGDINITTNNNTTINGDVYINKPEWFDPKSW